MCDRFSITADIVELREHFQVNKVMASYALRYNISPTHDITIVIGKSQERKLVDSRWGLFPFWAKDSVNADFESVQSKPVFERILKKQRCIIPCSGFYGFRPEGKTVRPYRFVLKETNLFGMAGLYEERVDPRGRLHRSCTIVTTVPNRLVADYSSRMPVILENDEMDRWLDSTPGTRPLPKQPFEPYSGKRMQAYPVSAQMLDEHHDAPDCIAECSAGLKVRLKN
jgi:putative SOS response-associated peptidase YedK